MRHPYVPAKGEVTQLLQEHAKGDVDALGRLFEQVRTDLQRLARARLAGRSLQDALSASDLIQEAFLKLLAGIKAQWPDRKRFFAYLGCLMEGIVVDHIRTQTAQKRGGDLQRVPVEIALDRAKVPPLATSAIGVSVALEKLDDTDPELATIVRLRFFGEFTLREIAKALDIPLRTLMRRWKIARLWLYDALREFDA